MGKRVSSIRFGKRMHEKAPHPVSGTQTRAALALFWAVLLALTSHAQSNITLDETWVDHPYQRNAGIRRTPDTLLLPLAALNQTHYLLVENPHLNHIGFLQIHHGKSMKAGDSLPFSHRPVPFRMFVFQVEAQDQRDTIRLVLEKKGEN